MHQEIFHTLKTCGNNPLIPRATDESMENVGREREQERGRERHAHTLTEAETHTTGELTTAVN